MYKCNNCQEFGLSFNRRYAPDQFLEGKFNSRIWIIGLNPAVEIGWNDLDRGKQELSEKFDSDENIHSYFKNFKRVSEKLYSLLGKDKGVAHTDLVKCSSRSWPPNNCKSHTSKAIVNNCHEYLLKQIKRFKPQMIICNGAPVSDSIKSNFKVVKKISDTAFQTQIDDHEMIVILSGFIGRIDNYARRRLGYEIESLIDI